jgi:hypothetical protein
VRIDLTEEEAKAEPGSLRLQNPAGGYNVTRAIASSFEPNVDHNTVDVQFKNVPTTASYTLTYIGGDGHETVFLQNIPFHNLQESSQSTQSAGAPATTPEEQS